MRHKIEAHSVGEQRTSKPAMQVPDLLAALTADGLITREAFCPARANLDDEWAGGFYARSRKWLDAALKR
jgi:hypothetical protein